MNRVLIAKFQQLIQSVVSKLDIHTILKQALQKYSIRSFNISKITVHEGLKLYRQAFGKTKQDDQLAKTSWLSNQKRVYLWFCLIYQKFIQKSIQNFVSQDWIALSQLFPGKQPDFLQYQAKNIIIFPRTYSWTSQEDYQLTILVEKYGLGKWNEIAKDMFFNSNKIAFRKPKQCRERWLNYLDSKKSRGEWTSTQDQIIVNFVRNNGQKWSKIARALGEHRTQHMVKNRYFSLLRKQRKQKRIHVQSSVKNSLINEKEVSNQAIKQEEKEQEDKQIVKQQSRNENNHRYNGQSEPQIQVEKNNNNEGQHLWDHSIPPNYLYWNYYASNCPPFYPIKTQYINQFYPYSTYNYFGDVFEQFPKQN